MKMKSLLALALTFSAASAFADTAVIPKEILERHAAACSGVTELYPQVYTLPSSEYSPKIEKTLYILSCELYAYNSMEKAYIMSYEINNVSVAEIDEAGSIYATSSLMGTSFNPATLTLETSQRGRGMGDCGSAFSYKYEANYERFVLVEARVKDNCDGVDGEWPVVYKK